MNTKHFSEVYLGADHGGFEYKEVIKPWLEAEGYTVHDCGAFKLDEQDDYPEFAFKVAEAVAANSQSAGVLLCRSGAGMIIAANKVPGCRAVVASNEQQARHSREHNGANVVALSGDWMSIDEMKEVLATFLNTPSATEERHLRRIEQITTYEQNRK
ncbi:MAG: RpiB/LacA/LacB family sugar-phosphate isomerase [Patescibacteria group bacterium]